jgi:hypothetical protein
MMSLSFYVYKPCSIYESEDEFLLYRIYGKKRKYVRRKFKNIFSKYMTRLECESIDVTETLYLHNLSPKKYKYGGTCTSNNDEFLDMFDPINYEDGEEKRFPSSESIRHTILMDGCYVKEVGFLSKTYVDEKSLKSLNDFPLILTRDELENHCEKYFGSEFRTRIIEPFVDGETFVYCC